MFKLIKILNSGVNVPEIEKFPCAHGLELDAGSCVLYDNDRGEIYVGAEVSCPPFIVAKAVKKDDTFALCYRISPGMIFEVPVIGDPANISPGLSVELMIESGRGAYAISDTDGGPAKIYSLEGATKSGDKVLITFNV